MQTKRCNITVILSKQSLGVMIVFTLENWRVKENANIA